MRDPIAPLMVVGVYLLAAAAALMVRTAVTGRFHDRETESRGESAILPMSARLFFAWALQPIWVVVKWSGVPATGITTLATLLSIGSGLSVASGHLAFGGWLYLSAGICDVLDGRIARHQGSAGPRGAAIDSVLDRYSDAAVVVGLAWYYRGQWPLVLALSVLVGSLLVSYVRARGEGLEVDVKVGLMQRPERVVLIGAALALAPVVEVATSAQVLADTIVVAVMAFVAVMTHVTALHRLSFLLRRLDRRHRARSPWQRVIPAVVSAALATAADFGLVTYLVSAVGVSPSLATGAGCLLGGVINFSLNRWWTFSSDDRPAPQAVRYTIVSVTSALLNSGGVALVGLLALPDYRIAWFVVRGLVFLCWNFPLQRDYVYGAQGADKPAASVPTPADAQATGRAVHG